jgi:hypothetical protein
MTTWDEATYRAYQLPLDFLDWHLWGVRYAAQCRLRGARRLITAGANYAARASLRRTRDIFSARAILSGKSDRATRARAAAGLAALGEQEAWLALKAESSMRDWYALGADAVWAQVT